MAAALFATLSLAMVASAFRASRQQQVVEAERITLRGSTTSPRLGSTGIELSVGPGGGLQVQFTADSTVRRALSASSDLRLVDATGREIARLGPPRATTIGK